MKKYILPALLLTATAMFTACGSSSGTSAISSLLSGSTSSSSSSSSSSSGVGSALTNLLSGSSSSSSSSSSTTGSVISNLLSSLLGSSSSLSQDDLVGTWNYKSPSCAFESESLLAKAGGEVAAAKIETEMESALSKVGIKSGSCSFTFNKDNTYSAVVGGKKISGSYTLNASEKTIKMTYLNGLGSMTPKVTKSGSTLSLLFESDKLLTLMNTVSSLSSSSSAKTLSTLLSNYDGMYVGMELQK